MRNVYPALMVTLALMLPAGDLAYAQSSGKMYCWKNKSGHTECGDKIPYEYQDSAIRELNKQGVVTSRGAAITADERKAREAAEEKRRAELALKEEQRRKDKALMDTFSNQMEIDLKRTRDVQIIESNIEILQSNLKNIGERQAYARSRSEQYNKDKRPVPKSILDDIERANADRLWTVRQIALTRKEITALHQQYDELKKRFAELTASAPASEPNAVPAAAGGGEPKPR